MSLELALDLGKTSFTTPTKRGRLGSVISVCGGLISFPSSPLDIETPVGFFTRQSPKSQLGQKSIGAVKRAFKKVEVVEAKGPGEGMPKGREEWEGLMRFWGEVLIREDGWKGKGEVYEVVK